VARVISKAAKLFLQSADRRIDAPLMLARAKGKRGSKRAPPKTARRVPQVPYQFLGYALQPIRFLHLALTAPAGSLISLEVFEDVGVERPDGSVLASQVKAGTVKNPIANRSPDLWRTLANWCEAIASGDIDPERTIFEIYVGKSHSGKIAELLHEAHSDVEASAALAEAKRLVFGGQSQLGDAEVDRDIAAVFRTGEHVLKTLIMRLRIETPKCDPISDLRPLVVAKWVRPESVDAVIQHAHGWITEQIAERIRARRPAVLSVDAFNEEMRSFLPRCDFRQIVACTETKGCHPRPAI